jgi:hypothetical protein
VLLLGQRRRLLLWLQDPCLLLLLVEAVLLVDPVLLLVDPGLLLVPGLQVAAAAAVRVAGPPCYYHQLLFEHLQSTRWGHYISTKRTGWCIGRIKQKQMMEPNFCSTSWWSRDDSMRACLAHWCMVC